MVLIYLAAGIVFLFTDYIPVVKGAAKEILGGVFVLYAAYRAYFVYRNYIQDRR